jgi:GTP-binding protein EngB required for normal cell division
MITSYSNILPYNSEKNSIANTYHHIHSSGYGYGKIPKNKQKRSGLLERIFSNKTKSLKSTVTALLNEIELRRSLDSQLIQKIEEQICEQNTQIMQLDNLSNPYDFERFLDINAKKKNIESNVLELEKEKRKENLECWRDLMFLNKYLHSALKSYWDMAKKQEVLSDSYTQNESLATRRRNL